MVRAIAVNSSRAGLSILCGALLAVSLGCYTTRTLAERAGSILEVDQSDYSVVALVTDKRLELDDTPVTSLDFEGLRREERGRWYSLWGAQAQETTVHISDGKRIYIHLMLIGTGEKYISQLLSLEWSEFESSESMHYMYSRASSSYDVFPVGFSCELAGGSCMC